MASIMVKAIFDPAVTNYIADRGTVVPGVKFVFRDPGNIDIDAVLAAVGARLRTPADTTVCDQGVGFVPRKLKFIRLSGNSFTVVAPLRGSLQITSYANAIITAVGAADPVVCIQLSGERWQDLFPELSTRTAVSVAGVDPRTIGKKGYFTGSYTYNSDVYAVAPLLKLKVNTDVPADPNAAAPGNVAQPPTILETEWNTCVGTPQNPSICPNVAGLDHRRYIAVVKVARATSPGGQDYASVEIPETGGTDASILACGVAIANNASVDCLGYEGESIAAVHRTGGVILL